eukprot:650876-Pleurochrysis_carterae.AAC.2
MLRAVCRAAYTWFCRCACARSFSLLRESTDSCAGQGRKASFGGQLACCSRGVVCRACASQRSSESEALAQTLIRAFPFQGMS